MEDLISLLTNNFHFVIIAIGIIYSLFFRKSPNERPPNRRPDVGGDDRQRSSRPEDEVFPVETAATRSAPEELSFPELRQTVRPETRRGRPVASSAAETSVTDRAGNETAAQGLSATELSRAVLWAEILGPPRARRPYRR